MACGRSSFSVVSICIWIAAFGAGAATQRFARLATPDLPVELDPDAPVLHVGDVDGDGAVDLVQGDGKVLRNDGLGRFELLAAPEPALRVIAVRDIDRDGRAEVIGFDRGRLEYLRAGADGTATRTVAIDVDLLQGVGFADIDGVPGDELLGLDGQRLVVWRTTAGVPGQPFDDDNRFPAAGLVAVVAGDVDGDGDDDLVLCRRGGFLASRLWLGDRSGKLADRGSLPIFPGVLGAKLVDVDGDGDLDLVSHGEWLQLFVNDGRGRFTDLSRTRLPASPSSAPVAWLGAADVDRDGDVDLAVAGRGWLVNDGLGRYRFDQRSMAQVPERVLAIADLDGDGDVDVVAAPRRVWWNDGSGQHQPAADPLPAERLDGRAVVDLDGDGDLDFLGRPGEVWLGGPNGYTRRDLSALLGSPARWHPLPIDVDGDGDLDLLVSIPGRSAVVLENRGAAVFAIGALESSRLAASERDGALVGADLDADGDTDVIHVAADGTAEILRNDGVALAAVPGAIPFGTRVRSLLALDYDGDGVVELIGHVLGNRPEDGDTVVWLQDREGNFRIGRSVYGAEAVIGVFDVDADGRPDVVSAAARAGRIRVAVSRNLGRDGFEPWHAATIDVPGPATRIVRCDVDADGDPDVLVVGTSSAGPWSRWLANDGHGQLTAMPFRPGDDRIPAFAAVDIDGDGDEDLIAEDGIHANLRRQLRMLRSPRLGMPFSLGCDARADRGASAGILVFAAPVRLATARQVELFGSLWLDPQRMFSFAWVGSTPDAPTEVQFPIPADVRLVGARFVMQALVQEHAGWHLGNVAEVTVLR